MGVYMPQVDVGTELNWLALELVVKYTEHDRDLCKAASRAVETLRSQNYAPAEKKIKIAELAKI